MYFQVKIILITRLLNMKLMSSSVFSVNMILQTSISFEKDTIAFEKDTIAGVTMALLSTLFSSY